MKAVKVFNNNAISVMLKNGEEAIVTGKAIGFKKRPGDTIDENKIEKTYYFEEKLQKKYMTMLKNIHSDALSAAEDIFVYANNHELKLNEQMIFALADHISFAIDRIKENMDLSYLMMSETKLLYPKEYETAAWALSHIKEVTGVELPESEIGYIALHLASSSMSREQTMKVLCFVKGIMDIIVSTYGIALDPNDLSTIRLMTHLKFLAKRIFKGEQSGDEYINDIYNLLINKHLKNEECLINIKDFVDKNFNYDLSQEEEVYLLIHLSRIYNYKNVKDL